MANKTVWSPACRRRRWCKSTDEATTSDEDLLSDAGIDVDDDEGLESIPANKLCLSSKLTIPTPRMDTYRFSMANMEDSQDIELDAILGELCALEDKLDREIMPKSQSANQALGNAWMNSKPSGGNVPNQNNVKNQLEPKATSGHSRSNSGGSGTRPKFEIGGLQVDMYSDEFLRSQKSDLSLRTESPDNDSAFSDNVSMLSSESSASSGGVRGEGHSSRSMSSQSSCMSLASSPTQVEQAARLKAEKIKIALEKMKEASIKKLFIKAFSADNSAKSLLIDERMTVGHVCKLLAEKNHVAMDPKWALVEHIPELYIERVYEDHEHVVENLLLWTRDSCNRLFFLEREEKYDLFLNPQNYLLGGTSSEKHAELDDDAKNNLLDEFFSSNVGVSEVEGSLYLKSDGKKAWKKHFFVLRASGLYYCPKGKSKLSKDLLCLTTFDMNNVYIGFGWKKKYKSPTEFGFAIKHPQIQTKSSKYIKYLCAENEKSLKQWMMGIRLAKYGPQLKENYDNLLRDIAEEDLESLANARSFSISSMAKHANGTSENCPNFKSEPSSKTLNLDQIDDEPPTTLEKLHKLRVISRQDSIKSSKSNTSSSSGCPSERSSSGTPTTDHLVFDTDFPMGTIKRKPTMTPKIPLTSTTRNLAKQSGEDAPHLDCLSNGSGGSCNGSLNGSLGRSTCGRFSLRRSKTDDRISLGSLSRKSKQSSYLDTPPSTLLREDLPLPPPPPEVTNMTECMNFDTLPPPPPEAFRNGTLDLENLPPPPIQTDEDLKWLDETNISNLPPPPSPQINNSSKGSTPDKNSKNSVRASPAVPPKPRKGIRRRQSESDARSTPPRLSEHKNKLVVIKPKPSKNLNLALSESNPCDENKWNDVFTPVSPPCTRSNRTSCVDDSKSPALPRSRRTSAPCVPNGKLQIHSIVSPTEPSKPTASDRKSRSQFKPSPPKRSENTKLTSAFTAPQRRSASASAAPYDQEDYPPESFLRNLQKVMVRKWKVAQQLSNDNTATSHQIFGFRDPNCLPSADGPHPLQRSPSSPPPLPNHVDKHKVSRSSSQCRESKANSKKQPPPPPPKKSETKVSLW
ncbi:ras-associated and pleckstrin homology domains-containing protein 1 [Trichonephila inaurata madagascariensis]|uniref:Ras-associated and pleckstrin homology domains-containing protein 1 n=1 Tax=Trichonephila inaurata madagascariensis TaxID=2747483 RepID=A0A8X6XQP6_9ARAC|nr:ras-associated and pleckstrin homology domains-containing protein 1 [Trichonephila inaurata madagascariensis]